MRTYNRTTDPDALARDENLSVEGLLYPPNIESPYGQQPSGDDLPSGADPMRPGAIATVTEVYQGPGTNEPGLTGDPYDDPGPYSQTGPTRLAVYQGAGQWETVGGADLSPVWSSLSHKEDRYNKTDNLSTNNANAYPTAQAVKQGIKDGLKGARRVLWQSGHMSMNGSDVGDGWWEDGAFGWSIPSGTFKAGDGGWDDGRELRVRFDGMFESISGGSGDKMGIRLKISQGFQTEKTMYITPMNVVNLSNCPLVLGVDAEFRLFDSYQRRAHTAKVNTYPMSMNPANLATQPFNGYGMNKRDALTFGTVGTGSIIISPDEKIDMSGWMQLDIQFLMSEEYSYHVSGYVTVEATAL